MRRHSSGVKPLCSNSIHGCTRESISFKTLVCSSCYSSMRYHVKLGTAHVIQFQQNIKFWFRRAQKLPAGNVKHHRRKTSGR